MPSTETSATRAMRWLRELAQPVHRPLAIAAVWGTLQATAMCAGAWLLAHVLAQAIMARHTLADLWLSLLALAGLALLRGVLAWRQRNASDDAARQVTHHVHCGMQQHLRALGPSGNLLQSSGDLVTRLVDGVDALAPYYAGYLPQAFLAVSIPALVLIAVLSREPWSALVLAACLPLLPIFMILVGRAAGEASERRWLQLRRLSAQFMDAVSGLSTLRLYRAAQREQDHLAQVGEAYRRETMAVLRVAFLSALVMEFFATVSIAVVAVMVGFRLMSGHLRFEAGLFALLLAPEFFLPLRQLGSQRHQRMEAVAAAEGLVELLATPTPQTKPGVNPMPYHARPLRLGIRLEQVVFGYEPTHAVLRGIDLDIPAGTQLTLVGASGGGKSSLLKLLMGFAMPSQGRILIDGEDLASLDLQQWRQTIMWVSQRPHVFRGSLRDNLLLARPQVDEVSLARVVRQAGLDAVIARLPQGLDTPLGERGHGLSGGEVQRLALARAWLRDAPLLLLDEPTQHLDAATAALIERSLATLGHGRTVLRIAHRLSSIADTDRVAVLDAGRIVETGLAAELRQAGGAYAALLREARAG